MKTEKAILELKKMAINLTGEDLTEVDDARVQYLYDMLKAIETAQKALEKQTPIKLTDIKRNTNLVYGECKCGEVNFRTLSYTNNYCDNCGQAIDWSE